MEQAKDHRAHRRRITAGAVKQQTLAYLAAALPAGWISQPLAADAAMPAAAGDILIISPRGRCHFLFVRAPADRWWDGGPHRVPAEAFSARDAALARQLRAAGHKARAIWGEKDLARALRAWGCPLQRPVAFAAQRTIPSVPAGAVVKPARPRLHLGGARRAADA
ncbi:MAG: hypothetical protein Kow00114_08540 [Kiloniellaceae bacterium]